MCEGYGSHSVLCVYLCVCVSVTTLTATYLVYMLNQECIIEEGEYPTSLWACVTTLYVVHDLCNDIHMLEASVLYSCLWACS